jgi:hypothetical protein
MSRSRRQRCQHGQRQSWLEKKLRRPEPGRPSTGGTDAGVGLLGPRAGLMSSGDSWLRLRSGQSSRLLGPGSWRRPRRRWPRRGADRFLRGGDPPTVSPSEARSDSTEGGVDAEGAAAPPADVRSCRNSLSVVCVCFFGGRRGPNISSSCCRSAFLFPLFRVSGLVRR